MQCLHAPKAIHIAADSTQLRMRFHHALIWAAAIPIPYRVGMSLPQKTDTIPYESGYNRMIYLWMQMGKSGTRMLSARKLFIQEFEIQGAIQIVNFEYQIL